MSAQKKCAAITTKKVQCSRNALENNLYCTQHKKSYNAINIIPIQENKIEIKVETKLKQQSIQLHILVEILKYVGFINGLNEEIHKLINRDQIYLLKHWFVKINVKTKFNDVSESNIKFLIELYNHKLDGRPRQELIDQFSISGFDKYIFHSKIWYFDYDKFEDYRCKNHYDKVCKCTNTEIYYDEKLVELSNKIKNNTPGTHFLFSEYREYTKNLILKNIDISKIRNGDVISFRPEKDVDEFCCFIFNNNTFYILSEYDNIIGGFEYDNFYVKMENLDNLYINNLPNINYFNTLGLFNNISTKLLLKSTKKPLILITQLGDTFKYETSDGYIIYTDNKKFNIKYLKEDYIILYLFRNQGYTNITESINYTKTKTTKILFG